MSKKVQAPRESAREVMKRIKASRNKRFDPVTGECAPKGEKVEKIHWEELSKINDTILKQMTIVLNEVNHLVNNEIVKERIVGHEDEALFNGAYNQFIKDTDTFLTDLEKTLESHVDKKGEIKTQEELMSFQEFYNVYNSLNGNFADLTQPAASTLALIATSLMTKEDAIKKVHGSDGEIKENEEVTV